MLNDPRSIVSQSGKMAKGMPWKGQPSEIGTLLVVERVLNTETLTCKDCPGVSCEAFSETDNSSPSELRAVPFNKPKLDVAATV